ncbi:MAG TPA: PPC domain-containing DNA-binding protein [Rhizomicrobium sp.]|nr:PPC domain-containing DNA-binding protein [Rhizomicrobium sp.]
MQSKLVSSSPRIWVLVLAPGEEAKTTIVDFAKKTNLKAASLVALGAFERAKVGYFDWQKKEYLSIPVEEQVEVISLIGDIAENDKHESDLHAHTVLGRRDGSTRGGHLLEGIVRPTLEVTLTETPAHLRRRMHPDINVALIDIS